MAGETGCRLHIVHVSAGRGIELVATARGKASMSPAKPARTTWSSATDDAPTSAHLQSAHRRCDRRGCDEVVESSRRRPNRFRGFGSLAGASVDQERRRFLQRLGRNHRRAVDASALLTQSHAIDLARSPASKRQRRAAVQRRTKRRLAKGNDADLTLVDLGAKYELTREMLAGSSQAQPVRRPDVPRTG